MRKCLLIALGLGLAATGTAAAQSGPPNPFTYSCGEYVAAETSEQKYVDNLMLYWAVGYMHGRFAGEPAVSLDGANHDSSVNDVANALQQICPNVPDMPIAEFIANLAGDLQKSLDKPAR